jgi:hypothetical protein
MKIIHKYLHEFDFPFSEFLRSEKENIVEWFYNNEGQDGTADKNIKNSPVNDFFNNRIKDLIETYYYIIPTIHDIDFNIYIQDNNPSPTNFHTHIHVPQAISGVMYLDVPLEGGEFEIFHEPHILKENPLRIKPQEDKLYLFPPWLHHRPLPQKDTTPRLCVNIGYLSDSKPMLKNFGIKW